MKKRRRRKNGLGTKVLYLFLVAIIMGFLMGIAENRYAVVLLQYNFDIGIFLSIFGIGVVSILIAQLIYGRR